MSNVFRMMRHLVAWTVIVVLCGLVCFCVGALVMFMTGNGQAGMSVMFFGCILLTLSIGMLD
jgi:hypothetical protein